MKKLPTRRDATRRLLTFELFFGPANEVIERSHQADAKDLYNQKHQPDAQRNLVESF